MLLTHLDKWNNNAPASSTLGNNKLAGLPYLPLVTSTTAATNNTISSSIVNPVITAAMNSDSTTTANILLNHDSSDNRGGVGGGVSGGGLAGGKLPYWNSFDETVGSRTPTNPFGTPKQGSRAS